MPLDWKVLTTYTHGATMWRLVCVVLLSEGIGRSCRGKTGTSLLVFRLKGGEAANAIEDFLWICNPRIHAPWSSWDWQSLSLISIWGLIWWITGGQLLGDKQSLLPQSEVLNNGQKRSKNWVILEESWPLFFFPAKCHHSIPVGICVKLCHS